MRLPVGIGLDLIDLDHFRVHYGDEDPDLLARCFTPGELDGIGSGADRLARLAARFALKEATFKALGGGLGIALTDVETTTDRDGHPQVVLRGPAKDIAARIGVTGFLVSLTHSAASAAAVVVALSGGPR